MKPKSFSGSHQLGFGFDDAVVPLPPVTASRRSPKPPAVTAAVPSPARATSALFETLPSSATVVRVGSEADTDAGTEAEAMAKLLDAHPDFRVLRRLLPRLAFPPVSGPVATLLVLDTETTGLNPARDKVVELALLRVTVDLRTGQPVGPVQVYDGLEDPGLPMPAEIIAITGITDAMLRGQRLDEAEVLRLLDGVDLVVAHNAGFDRPFVEARLPR
jgi:DNA polymerase-3 subunit epsilon